MRRYETIYILHPNLSEDEITSRIDSANEIITGEQGTIINLDRWGMRKLAYLIKKEKQGYYVFCDYATAPTAVSEMERKFRIDEGILKYMTVKLADDISAEEVEAAKGELAARKEAEEAEEAKKAEEAEATAEENKKPVEAKAPAEEVKKAEKAEAATEESPEVEETEAKTEDAPEAEKSEEASEKE
ncbi:MAG: 30S ribosomal protein S6 [Thermodesulfobacteriota bacterium]